MNFSLTLMPSRMNRRALVTECAVESSLLALPSEATSLLSENLPTAPRQPVNWWSLLGCPTGTESLTQPRTPPRGDPLVAPNSLNGDLNPLAASDPAAERNRERSINNHLGRYRNETHLPCPCEQKEQERWND